MVLLLRTYLYFILEADFSLLSLPEGCSFRQDGDFSPLETFRERDISLLRMRNVAEHRT